MLNAGTPVGPYEIVAQIEAGGMGEVYRARDTRLGRDVAIKVLPAELASDPERLRRFEQEARAVAALSHPNILAVFDVGTHDGVPYLVTELLEGEALRERLQAGPLPPSKAVELAIHIAQGLAAAHEKGIVHRDLKPGNLFLTADGHLKILDFGIAKLVAPKQAVELARATTIVEATEVGTTLGTVGYMSPEQVRGRSVDHRSDIFSFGCVLYEMLSGQRPFVAETRSDVLAAILKEDPPVLPERVPPVLAAIVGRCLEKRPEDRFSSARDLGLALRAAASDAEARVTGGVEPPRSSRRRGAHTATGAVLVLALAVTGVVWLRAGRPTGSSAVALDPAKVMVAPFANATGDASLEPVTTRVAEAVTRGLLELRNVDVVPVPRGVTSADEAALCAAARKAGAGVLASGTAYLSGDTLELRGRLVDAAIGTPIYALTPERGPRDNPEQAIDHVRQRAMTGVAIHLGRYPDLGGMRRPPLYSALREWVTARELMNAGADLPAWRQHLEKAIELDPEFWMPQVFLSWSYYGVGDDARLEELRQRLHANQDRMDEAERLIMQISEANREGRPLEALRLARTLLALAPEDPVYRWVVAANATYQNRPREALRALGDLEKLDWGAQGSSTHPVRFIATAALAHHLLGEHQAELAIVRYGLGHYPDSLHLRLEEVKALAALGHVSDVEEVIGEVLHTPTKDVSAQDVIIAACKELRAHGHSEDARRIASKALDRYADDTERGPESVDGALDRVAYLSLAERWNEARALAKRVYEAHPDEPRAQACWGIAAARAGDRTTAETIARALAARGSVTRFQAWPLAWDRAAIAAQLGDRERAMELLRQALNTGAHYLGLHVDPDLEPLHGYPPFEELMKPKD